MDGCETSQSVNRQQKDFDLSQSNNVIYLKNRRKEWDDKNDGAGQTEPKSKKKSVPRPTLQKRECNHRNQNETCNGFFKQRQNPLNLKDKKKLWEVTNLRAD